MATLLKGLLLGGASESGCFGASDFSALRRIRDECISRTVAGTALLDARLLDIESMDV